MAQNQNNCQTWANTAKTVIVNGDVVINLSLQEWNQIRPNANALQNRRRGGGCADCASQRRQDRDFKRRIRRLEEEVTNNTPRFHAIWEQRTAEGASNKFEIKSNDAPIKHEVKLGKDKITSTYAARGAPAADIPR